MERTARELPEDDLLTLHCLVAVTEGHLAGGALPPDLIRALIRSFTDRGRLPPGSSAGDLTALLADLGQRLHWAMDAVDDYPAPMAHRATHNLNLPRDRVAESIEELIRLGGQDIEVRPSTSRSRQRHPTGPGGAWEWHSTGVADAETVSVSFPGLPPDAIYQDRVSQLTALAESHGGQYAGAGY